MGVPGGGAEGAAAPPPQFVGQTKPVGQYSLHSRAILAYYKNKWDNHSLSILWEILSTLWEICYLIGIFRNHSSLPPPPPPSTTILESFSEKFLLTTWAQSEKVGQISFRPLIFPSRTPMFSIFG